MKKGLKMFNKYQVYPNKNNLFSSGQSFARSDAEIAGAERQEMKMMTEVEKEQWETLELRNSMKRKSYTFKDSVKMNKRQDFFTSHYLWHLLLHDFIEAKHISGFQEGLNVDKLDPYEDVQH